MRDCEVCNSNTKTNAVLCFPSCGFDEGRRPVVVQIYGDNSSEFVFNNTNGMFSEGGLLDVDVVRDQYQQFWLDFCSLWQAANLNPGPGRLVMVWPLDDGSGL